jgi:membrane-bound acyltransferase YfiQ involved in biofilm formation
MGTWAAEHYTQLERIHVRWSLLALVAFIVMSVCHFVGGYNAPLEYAMQWMGIPAFVGVTWLLMQVAVVRKALVYVSVNCFGVYLLHMFFVQAGAMVVAHLPWAIPSWGYVIYLLISTVVSIGATVWGYNAINRVVTKTKTKTKTLLTIH